MSIWERHKRTREEQLKHLLRFATNEEHAAVIRGAIEGSIWDDELAMGTPIEIEDCIVYEPSNWDPERASDYTREAVIDYEMPLKKGDPCFIRAGHLWHEHTEPGDGCTRECIMVRHHATFIEDVRALPEPNAAQGPRFVRGRRCCMVELEHPIKGRTRFMVHASNIRYRRDK